MFRGSIPAPMQSIVAEHVAGWGCADLYVGCSGNFTIERVLADRPVRLHGNDVQLYSCCIGAYLAGQEFPIGIADEYRERFDWLEPYLETPAGRTATVMLSVQMLQGLNRENPYYERMRASYRKRWPEMHAKLVEKLSSPPVRLASFTAGDVRAYLRDAPKEAGAVVFPPFFKGDYESQFKGIDSVFTWAKPTYELLDDAGKADLIEQATAFRWWMLGLHIRPPELESAMRGIVQTTNRGVPIFIYTGEGPVRCVRPEQKVEPVWAPRLMAGDVLGDQMTLAVLTGGQFATLRSQYMNHNIRPGSPTLAVGVLVDGVVVGAFAFSREKYNSAPSMVYMLSDFPVAGSSYPKLAKLVLYAALSREAKLLAERSVSARVRTISTTAFTKRPVSMKYRGLFDLHSRKESPDPLYTWQLDYRSPAGRWSLAEGLQEWKRKHGQRSEGAGDRDAD